MPGLSGEELTTEIRKFDKNTPILFYSGAAYETDKQKAHDGWRSGLSYKAVGMRKRARSSRNPISAGWKIITTVAR
jgi:CheY-like chemotaxis protein